LAYAQPWNFKSWETVDNRTRVNVQVKLEDEVKLPSDSKKGSSGQIKKGWTMFNVATKGKNIITLPPGNSLSLSMTSNLTTGYKWQLMPMSGKCLELTGNGAEEEVLGGMATFRFRKVAGAEGTCKEDILLAWERGVVVDWAAVDITSVFVTVQ